MFRDPPCPKYADLCERLCIYAREPTSAFKFSSIAHWKPDRPPLTLRPARHSRHCYRVPTGRDKDARPTSPELFGSLNRHRDNNVRITPGLTRISAFSPFGLAYSRAAVTRDVKHFRFRTPSDGHPRVFSPSSNHPPPLSLFLRFLSALFAVSLPCLIRLSTNFSYERRDLRLQVTRTQWNDYPCNIPWSRYVCNFREKNFFALLSPFCSSVPVSGVFSIVNILRSNSNVQMQNVIEWKSSGLSVWYSGCRPERRDIRNVFTLFRR